MNFLLDIPRDILFLLVRHLDIHDIMRLSMTSMAIRNEITECVREIHFPLNDMWRLMKREKEETTPDAMFRKHTMRAVRYIYPDPTYYSLTLPPIALLKQYPTLIKSNAPFLGTIEDLLEIDPSSFSPQIKLSVICTSPQIPITSMSGFWVRKYWTPLPYDDETKSLYVRMREWLVSFILAWPDAMLSMIIVPERNLLQQETSFDFPYNSFSYLDRHVMTTLPYMVKLVSFYIGDVDIHNECPQKTDAVPVEQWLNHVNMLSTDDLSIPITDYPSYREDNDIHSLVYSYFPHRFRYMMGMKSIDINSMFEDFFPPFIPHWYVDDIKQKVGRVLRSTSHVPRINHSNLYGDTPEDIPSEITPHWDLDVLRQLVIRYQKEMRRTHRRKEMRLTLVPRE